MAKVVITNNLKKQVMKIFKQESISIFEKMKTLENNPHKGKALSSIGGIVIKELKYKKFRFYFLTDGQMLKFGTEDELASLLIKFVRMSEKKDQEKNIRLIKDTLLSMGFKKFE